MNEYGVMRPECDIRGEDYRYEHAYNSDTSTLTRADRIPRGLHASTRDASVATATMVERTRGSRICDQTLPASSGLSVPQLPRSPLVVWKLRGTPGLLRGWKLGAHGTCLPSLPSRIAPPCSGSAYTPL